MPLEIKGVLPDVEIKYAFRRAKQGAKERLREQRRRMKEAFEAEYGKNKPAEEEKSRLQDWQQRTENGEFVIEAPEDAGMRKQVGQDSTLGKASGFEKPVKQDTLKKKKKYNTEDDFRIEFEDD